MNSRAWTFIWSTYAVAGLLVAQAVTGNGGLHFDGLAFEVLLTLAICAQLFKVEAPNHVMFYATPIFFFAGALLLEPLPLFLLIAIPHVAEWAKERWSGSDYLRAWYLQPFNIAMFWISARGSQGVIALLHQHVTVGTGWELAAVAMGAVFFVIVNHALLATALVLARGIPWSESGILESASMVSDFVLLCVGSTFAALWLLKPWFVVFAVAPIALVYQALMIPRLKREAERDAKTGLFNARHFNALFAAELDRAQRFDRPLAVVMADLDHLRSINNSRGHLAGDAVLLGVSEIILSTVRDYDVAARFGGEEFALLLPEADEEQARVFVDRLRKVVESSAFSVSTSAAPIHASMSIGIACYPHDGQTTTDLLHAADRAVYAAKGAGRNCAMCASDLSSMDAPLTQSREEVWTNPTRPARGDAIAEPTAAKIERENGETPSRPWVQAAFVSAVTAAALIALFATALTSRGATPELVLLLAGLGGLAELLEVDLFGQGTVSVSVGVAFTASLLAGVEGLAVVSGVIALVHHVRQRRGFNHLHRAAFNWAVHILAGLLIVLALRFHAVPLAARNLSILVPIVLAAAIGYFGIETGLIASAVALARGENVARVWRDNYRWLLPHYVVLCCMGLALSVTFTELGPTGVMIFTVPLVMMHFVQRQHILQSRENLHILQRMNRDLVRAALHDHLTGLGNDRGFQEALQQEVRACSERERPICLARLNLDDFRSMNEELGRRHGDGMLKELADMIVGTPGLHRAFRLVADDFAVIMPNTSGSEAVELLDGFRARVPDRLGGGTISVGVAWIDGTDLDPDLVNEQALRTLEEAKRRGRNVVVTFDAIRDSTMVASWAQAQSVRKMLVERRIDIAFQPIWDIDRRSILGYEALARPACDYCLVGPQEAFDVAARIGKAKELDGVCREAILARAHELPDSTRLFVNLAPESLELGGLTGEDLSREVASAGLRPAQVVFELTERSIVRTDAVVRQAQLLREYGFGLALDDTGAGNAGLGVLSQLEVDYVKIDRGVINHAATDQSARAVLAGIFALAREMRAYVIAEGIETIEMLELVRLMSGQPSRSKSGRGVQGFFLGAPRVDACWMLDESPFPREAADRSPDQRAAPAFAFLPEDMEPIPAGW